MVDVDMNHANIRALLTSPAGPVVRDVEKYTRTTANLAKAKAPTDNGALRASITSSVSIRGEKIVGRVSSPLDYARYQELGTGVYAGKGPIRPKKGKFLVFRPKKPGPQVRGGKGGKKGLVFATEVKGTPPTHFLEESLRAAVPWPVHRNRL